MEIKSIEKQGDIVTVKMTMPEYCTKCICYTAHNNYCSLFYAISKRLEDGYKSVEGWEKPPEDCPLRCNNG